MVRLEEHKHETENRRIEKLPLPTKAYIPLSQHIGKICEPLVKIGDIVSTGQKIGAVPAQVTAAVHASLSGKVSAITDSPHPVLGRSKAIIIESDGLDKKIEEHVRSKEEADNLTADEIRNIVSESGIVGMGGASFPTHIKLNSPKPIDTLIINGAECEPYLNSDNRLMIEKTKEIIAGIGLIVKCTGAKQVFIAIEDNKPEAIKAFKAISGMQYDIRVLKSQYPQGGEKQLIKAILKREVPSGKLPLDIGVVVQNVATVNAIYEAVYLGKPLYQRVVTVTGDCPENPGNFLVRIGTPIKDLIAKAGPLKKEPKKIVFGGPMMGIAQYSLDTPVVKSTNGIIVLSASMVSEAQDAICIRCGRCVEYCPAGLTPCLINLSSRKEKWDMAKAYGCLDCMECGLCNYVCPQKINLVQAIKQAKMRVPK